VGRAIACLAKLMEETEWLRRNNALDAFEKIGLLLLGRSDQAGLRGCRLGEHLAELTKLEEAGVGIILEVPLSLAAKLNKARAVRSKEFEVGRYHLHAPFKPSQVTA
jgi:hypothetical protein